MTKFSDLLTLEQLDANLFRSQAYKENPQGSLYGGQVLAQSLLAAQATVAEPDRQAHSLHGYFLRAGTVGTPVSFEVERIRDGRSFTTRRVVAIQNGKTIFSMAISFQGKEAGFSHQQDAIQMPPAPTDVDLGKLRERLANSALNPSQVDNMLSRNLIVTLPVFQDEFLTEQQSEPFNQFWFRSRQTLPDDRVVQQAALAFATDINLISTCLFPHPTSLFSGKQMIVSLDHAIWFHQSCNINDWLFFQTDSPWSGGGRGFNRGLIYNVDGELVASTTQEGLIRPIGR